MIYCVLVHSTSQHDSIITHSVYVWYRYWPDVGEAMRYGEIEVHNTGRRYVTLLSMNMYTYIIK